ncbi:MAG: aldehyde dehydrogenase family protein, partial [bacterium]|nr:aldehyde dehydrogenase family protein [bacterium]
MKRIHHWIDGKLTPGAGERRGAVYNPATGAQTGEVDFATVAEVDAAVASAREAFGFWREVPVSRRSEIL